MEPTVNGVESTAFNKICTIPRPSQASRSSRSKNNGYKEHHAISSTNRSRNALAMPLKKNEAVYLKWKEKGPLS